MDHSQKASYNAGEAKGQAQVIFKFLFPLPMRMAILSLHDGNDVQLLFITGKRQPDDGQG